MAFAVGLDQIAIAVDSVFQKADVNVRLAPT
jgi:hypothetical protein